MTALIVGLVFVRTSAATPLRDLWRTRIVPALRAASPGAAGGVLQIAGYQMDHAVASCLFPLARYGLYVGGAWQLSLAPLVLHGQRQTYLEVMTAHHAAGRHAEFWTAWRRLALPAFSLAAAIAAGLFASAPEVVRLSMGPLFAASVPVFRVYCPLLPLQSVSLSLLLRATGPTRPELGGGICFAVVSLATGALLTSPGMFTGPAWGVWLGCAAWAASMVSPVTEKPPPPARLRAIGRESPAASGVTRWGRNRQARHAAARRTRNAAPQRSSSRRALMARAREAAGTRAGGRSP